MSQKIKNALLKVTFTNILKNGTNSCWLPVKKEAFLSTIAKYWYSKANFHYLKIYDKDTRQQIGYITRQKIDYTPNK